MTTLDTELRSVLQTLNDLERLLDALGKLATAQMAASTEEQWTAILTRKQRVLDAIQACDPSALFRRAAMLAEGLQQERQSISADILLDTVEKLQANLMEIQAIERVATAALMTQMDTLRQQLIGFHQHQQATRAYQTPLEATFPRFLNNMR